MKREELDFLEKEQIDKVMSLYGKLENAKKKEMQDLQDKYDKVDKELSTYKTKVSEMETTLKDNEDFKTKFEELQTENKKREEEEKAKQVEKSLEDRFNLLVGDKKFTNEYARKGLYNDFKEQLNNKDNIGKGDKEILDALTKDISNVFESANKIVDMPGMGQSEEENNIKETPIIW